MQPRGFNRIRVQMSCIYSNNGLIFLKEKSFQQQTYNKENAYRYKLMHDKLDVLHMYLGLLLVLFETTLLILKKNMGDNHG